MKIIIYFIEYIVVKILFFLFKIIGYKNSSNLGFLIGKYFGPLFRSKSLIKNNLIQATTWIYLCIVSLNFDTQ